MVAALRRGVVGRHGRAADEELGRWREKECGGGIPPATVVAVYPNCDDNSDSGLQR
jgi:hypothetical protein